MLHDCLLDALTRKAGWVRWYWGARRDVRTEVCEGLLLPQLQMLLAEPGSRRNASSAAPCCRAKCRRWAKRRTARCVSQPGRRAGEYWSATITRSQQQAWPIVEAVPAECVWVVADANTVQDARAIFHVRDVSATELIEMGLPEDKVLAHRDMMMSARQRTQIIARNEAQGHNIKSAPPERWASMAVIRYAEGWIRADTDGDNKAELIHVQRCSATRRRWCNGSGWTRRRWPASRPTASRAVHYRQQRSQADMVMDLQRIGSRVMRAVLDSLAAIDVPAHHAVVVTPG